MKKPSLTPTEKKTLESMQEPCSMAYFAKEVVAIVASDLKCTKNQAKGYIGSLCKKGYVVADKYECMGIGLIEQFSIL